MNKLTPVDIEIIERLIKQELPNTTEDEQKWLFNPLLNKLELIRLEF